MRPLSGRAGGCLGLVVGMMTGEQRQGSHALPAPLSPVCTRLSGTSGVTPLFKAVPATRPMSCWPRRWAPPVSSHQPPSRVETLEGGDSCGHTEGWGQGWP